MWKLKRQLLRHPEGRLMENDSGNLLKYFLLVTGTAALVGMTSGSVISDRGCLSEELRLEGIEGDHLASFIQGVYYLTDQLSENGRPIFKHKESDVYLYSITIVNVTSDIWVVTDVEGTTAWTFALGASDDPREIHTLWAIWDGEDFQADSSLHVVCNDAKHRCSTGVLMIWAHSPTVTRQSIAHLSGNYLQQADMLQERPVYKHESLSHYLYFSSEAAGSDSGRWVVGSVLASDGMHYATNNDQAMLPELVTGPWHHGSLVGTLVQVEIYCTGAMSTACADRTCENGGTCTEPSPRTSLCLCKESFMGESCEREVECPEPPVPANGDISLSSGHSYMDTVLFSCDDGYKLDLSYPLSSTCGATGQWSQVGRCVPINGPAPILVAASGSDAADCGSSAEPCASLHAALLHAVDGEVIKVRKSVQPYQDCASTQIKKDVTISSEDETVEFVCPTGGQFLELADGSRLTLQNVLIRQGTISLKDAELLIEDSTLEDVFIDANGASKRVSLTVHRSHFRGTATCGAGTNCPASSKVEIPNTVRHVEVIVEVALLEGSLWTLGAAELLDVNIENVTSTGFMTESGPTENVKHGLVVFLPNGEADLFIRYCDFHHNRYVSTLASSKHAAVAIYDFFSGRSEDSIADVIIAESNFTENTRAIISDISYNLEMYVLFCHFENNTSAGPGGAIYIGITVADQLNRLFGIAAIVGNGLDLGVVDSTFVSNRAETYSILGYPGSGGAISAEVQGAITIVDCVMHNNSATESGGTISVGPLTTTTVKGVVMTNSAEGLHSFQGDIMYATGSLTLENVSFQMQTADSAIPLLAYVGADPAEQQATLNEIEVRCPVGYMLMPRNISTPNTRGAQFGQLYYRCIPCSDGYYSLEQGYLHYKSELDFFGLFTFSETHKVMNHTYRNVTCEACPYGARCEDGKVEAVMGYWGYQHENVLYFEMCHDGYCCEEETCEEIDACADHRSGTLCGECEADHSQVMHGPKCVPDENCDDSWVWLLYSIYALLYVLFFLLEPEWEGLLSTSVKRLYSRVKTTFCSCLPAYNDDNESGGLEIYMYYVQTAGLLSVAVIYGKDGSGKSHLRKATERITEVTGIDVLSLHDTCAVSGWDALSGLWLRGGFAFFLLVVLGALFGLVKLPSLLLPACRSQHNPGKPQQVLQSTRNCGCLGEKAPTINIRFSLALMDLFLYTYQVVAEVTLSLLHCVDVGGSSVLFIQGEIECLQGWQYFALMVCFFYVVPLFLVMAVGPGTVKSGAVPAWFFLVGCFLPPVFLLVLLVRKCLNKVPLDRTDLADKIVDKACGPFSEHLLNKHVCWEGVVILRRLVLIVAVTLISNPVTRMFVVTMICLVILLSHILMQPYKMRSSNVIECVTLSALCVVSTINLVKSAFSGLMVLPPEPMVSLLEVLDTIEFLIVTALPLLVVAVGVVMVVLALVALGCACCCRRTDVTFTNRQAP